VVGGYGATGSTTAYLPGSSRCYAIAQTNVHFGYNGPVDADAIRAAGAVRHGPCVVRTAIVEFRIGFANGQTFRDFRPSKSSSNSNNGLVPGDTLNSAGDFSPDVTYMPAWPDWVRVSCTDPQVRVRMVFQVRFSNGALVNYSIVSSWVSHDLNGCPPPPPPTADLEVTKFALDETTPKTEYTVPGDDFTYQVDVTNLGPNTATGVVLTEQWPVGVDPLTPPTWTRRAAPTTRPPARSAARLGTWIPTSCSTSRCGPPPTAKQATRWSTRPARPRPQPTRLPATTATPSP
jgi:uncharacterized repeat protein (TIGR01451 family)